LKLGKSQGQKEKKIFGGILKEEFSQNIFNGTRPKNSKSLTTLNRSPKEKRIPNFFGAQERHKIRTVQFCPEKLLNCVLYMKK